LRLRLAQHEEPVPLDLTNRRVDLEQRTVTPELLLVRERTRLDAPVLGQEAPQETAQGRAASEPVGENAHRPFEGLFVRVDAAVGVDEGRTQPGQERREVDTGRVNVGFARLRVFGLRVFGLRVFGLRVFGLRVFGLRVFGLRVFGLRVFGLRVFRLGAHGLGLGLGLRGLRFLRGTLLGCGGHEQIGERAQAAVECQLDFGLGTTMRKEEVLQLEAIHAGPQRLERLGAALGAELLRRSLARFVLLLDRPQQGLPPLLELVELPHPASEAMDVAVGGSADLGPAVTHQSRCLESGAQEVVHTLGMC